MTRTPTTRLLLSKPDPGTGEPYDVSIEHGSNLDTIDGAIGFTVCTSATRPTGADAWVGRPIRETDTGLAYICAVAGGSVWRQILADNSVAFLASGRGIDVERTGTAAAYRARNTGDSVDRLEIDSNGRLSWGSGSTGRDTNLYRSAANVLKTDDSLEVVGDLIVTGIGGVLRAVKTADTTRTSTTSVTNDPHLAVTVPASTGRWLVMASIAWSAHANADIQFGVSVPTSATFPRWRAVTDGAGSVWTAIQASAATTLFGVGASADRAMMIHGTLNMSSNAGTFAIRWGPNASVVDPCTVYAESWLRLERIG